MYLKPQNFKQTSNLTRIPQRQTTLIPDKVIFSNQKRNKWVCLLRICLLVKITLLLHIKGLVMILLHHLILHQNKFNKTLSKLHFPLKILGFILAVSSWLAAILLIFINRLTRMIEFLISKIQLFKR